VARRPIGTGLVDASSAWLVVFGIVVGYFTLLVALGGHAAWDALGVPPVSPGFFDLRSVTSGWECARQDLGAWPENPCDPWGRPENYPRIWIAASIFGLGEADTYVIGALIVVGFFVSAVLVLPRDAPFGDALVYGFALCSPAVMLGVERGNVDLTLFSMVVVAGLVMRRMPYGPPVSSTLILVAAVLKLFPVAAVGMLTGLPRRVAAACVSSVVAIFALYVIATLSDIRTIDRVLPQDDEYAYGVHITGDWLGHLAGSGSLWDAVLVASTIVAALAFRRRLSVRLAMGSSRELDLFCAGAGVYVATFALVRSADYRLVFLLLTVPQLARWAAARRVLAIATLAGVLVTLWLPTEWPWTNVPLLGDLLRSWNDVAVADGEILPLGAVAQVLAFAGLTCLLAAAIHANWQRRPVEVPSALASHST
jgi:hypothetical protein